MKKTLRECLEDISDDFQSTFTYVDENHLVNLLRGPHEFDEVKTILQKHLGEDIVVTFVKRGSTNDDHDIYDIEIRFI